MRSLATVLLALLLTSYVHGQVTIERARFAAADLDGDGRTELVIGGRLGPFRSAGSPGALQVGVVDGSSVRVANQAGGLPEIRDVGLGDVDGDGRVDAVTVGAGWLAVHTFENGRLAEAARLRLDSDWTDRVAVTALAGVATVAVTEYDVKPDGDTGTTWVRGFAATDRGLEARWVFDVRGHVGDLTFVESTGRTLLLLETGTGEEGGDIRVYDVTETPRLTWAGRVGDGRRCLAVEATGDSDGTILLRSVDGIARLCSVRPDRVSELRRLRIEPDAALAPVFDVDGRVRAIGLAARPRFGSLSFRPVRF